MSTLKKYLPLIGILIVALAVRLLIVFKYGHLWSDEWFSITYSQKSWWDSITKFWIWETNPPLHMVFLKIWFYIFPLTEFWARFSSTVIALGSIVALYQLNKKLFNQSIALVSAGIFSLISIHLFFSATVRAYSLLLLLTILCCHYFFTIFYLQQNSKKNTVLFIVVTTLLLYTHLTSTIILASQFITLLITNRAHIKSWILHILPAGLVWLVWAVPSLAYKASFNTVQNGWFFNITTNFSDTIEKIASLFIGYTSWIVGMLVLAGCIASVYIVLRRQHQQHAPDTNFLIVLILACFPLLCALLLNLLNIKFFLIALPWTITLASYLLYMLDKRYLAHILIFGILIYNTTSLYYSLPLNNWRPVNAYITGKYNPKLKQIIIYNSFTQKHEVDHYITTPLPTYPYIPKGVDWDNFLITNNYLWYIHPEHEMLQWLGSYDIDAAQEIILLDDKDVGIDIGTVLLQTGWKEAENPTKAPLAADVYIRYFKK